MSPDFAAALLGLASALTWGAGDFSGGLATKRVSALAVVIGSQMVGIGFLIALALAFAETIPPLSHWLWGGAAGIVGALALMALYRALATGRMGVVAPVSAVISAGVPVVFGIWFQGWPGALRLVGFALALLAVWLIARTEHGEIHWADLRLPILAGLGFGAFIVMMSRVNSVSVLWPLVSARLASISLLTAVALGARQKPWPMQAWPLVALCGVLDAGGNALVIAAAQIGRLDVAGVLSSLYPASTVLLAWLVLREKILPGQWLGVLIALGAIVCITL
jgi:drug/metabolite transporter (DMT)-like permease